MNTRTATTRGKGRIRAMVRVATRQDHTARVAWKGPAPEELTLCTSCGAVFAGKTWRLRPLPAATLRAATRDRCPACKATAEGTYFGRVKLTGAFVKPHEEEIRKRIANVARRAAFTQPQRRVVDLEWHGGSLHVLTTSQKLAHRIVRELHKAFHGEAAYRWSSRDGSLEATWSRSETGPS